MADVKTNQSKVYNALKGMGFSGIGNNEAEFAAKMGNAKNREKVYKALSDRGYKGIGNDLAAFDTLIYQAPDGAKPTPTEAQGTRTGAQAPAGEAAGTVVQGRQRTVRDIVDNIDPMVTMPEAEKEKQKSFMEASALSKLPVHEFERVMKERAGEAFDAEVKKQTGGKSQVAGSARQKYVEDYVKSAKEQMDALRPSLAEHDKEVDAYFEEMKRKNPIITAENTYTQLLPGETQSEYVQRMERTDLGLKRQRVANAQADVDRELEDISREEQAMAERYKERLANGGFLEWMKLAARGFKEPLNRMNPLLRLGDTYELYNPFGLATAGKDAQDDILKARRKQAEQTKDFLTNVGRDMGKDYSITGGLARAAQGVKDVAFDPDTWSFGHGDLQLQMSIGEAAAKVARGEALDHNEQRLLDGWAMKTAYEGQWGDELSGWTKAGLVTGESLPFMVEMVANPASGLGKGASKMVLKEAVKRMGTKWVRDHMKSVLAGRIAGRVLGDVAGATLMSTTTGAARVAADFERRMTGDVVVGQDEQGNIIFNGVKDAESPGAAFAKALASTSIDNWSEMAGEYLGFVNSFFGKALGKSVIGKAGRRMLAETGSVEGVSLNKAQKFIFELTSGKGVGAFNQALGKFAEKTQWHGMVDEYLEEVMGNIANAALVGDMTFDSNKDTGVFNLEQNIDTFCGVALMGGFMSAMNTVGYAGHRWSYNVDRVNSKNAQLFGGELWEDVKAMLDNSLNDPRELNDALTYLLRGESGKQFSADEKKAILKYTQAALEKEGGEMASYRPRVASVTRRRSDEHLGDERLGDMYSGDERGGWEVSSWDKNGGVIETRTFATEDEAKAYEGELKMRQQKQDYDDYLSMTGKLSFQEASEAVDEFLGLNGVNDGSIDIDEAMAAINDPKSELGKQFRAFKQERIIEKARRSRDAIALFEQEHGWSAGTVRWLSEQDPMELDAEGLQMADEARSFLEGLAYPQGEVHVEHEVRVGADAAQGVVELVASSEDGIDPMDNAGKQIRDEYNASIQGREQLFAHNEELKEEVERMEQMGLSAQEIVSSLDSFSPQDRQVMIDYYNAKARHDSFMEEAAKQIDNVARRNRERRTFTGTINGSEDRQHVVAITDGANTYTLVSGHVRTDGGGVITDSDSGLIIGVDANGDFVQIGDGDGYSVVPGGMTLDEWEAVERERLQEQVSLVVDPNGAQAAQEAAAQPQGTEQARAGQDNAGGEAGADGTGGNEPPAPAPSAGPTPPANPPSPAGDAAGTPAVSIESVTDKDGIKRYENGVSAEDAIADIQADGLDVGEVADASIAEAQQVVEKINGKQVKTRKDLLDRKRAQDVIGYYQALKERWAAMVSQESEQGESEENINNDGEEAVSEGNIVPSQAGSEAGANAPGTATMAVQGAGRRQLNAEEQKQERIKVLKAELGELFDDDFTKADDVYELVSMWVGRKRNLAWDDVNGKRGLQKELGWTRKIGGDTKFIETLLAKKGEGMGVDEFVHMVWESEENTVNGEKRFDTDEIKNALLDLLKSAQSKSDVVDYAVNTRERAARAALEAQQQMQQEAIEDGTVVDVAPLTDEEMAGIEASLPFATPTGEDIPDDPLSALWKVINEASQDGGMPAIRMVDTSQMSDGDWIDLASQVYSGAFVDSETVETVRSYAMETGVVYDEGTDVVNVFSGAVTPETLREKLEQIKSEYNGRETEEGSSNEPLRDSNLEPTEAETPQGEGGARPTEAGAAGTEGQGSAEPVDGVVPKDKPSGTVDPYLQPRNEKERQIIADVEAQLQQEIDAAVKARDKAASDLRRAQERESKRATDIFSDDEAFQEDGQLFSFDDMGGTDRTADGVERRTAAERRSLQDAQKRVDELQSAAERNSRIRGALDKERRQTSFIPGGETSGTVAGQPQSREEYLASHPLTEEQIMADEEATEDEKLNAIDFLRGEDDSAISRFYYDGIYERVREKVTNPLSDKNWKDIKPVGSGDFGDIYDQFKGKAREAIQFLLKKRSGEATGALHHKDIGDIDLVWGEEGTGKSDGYGLAKLAKYHPEVLDNLQEILEDMHVVSRTENRINLESDTHKAAVRLTWNEQKKKWLLTTFEKKNSALDNTTDTGKTSDRGKRNDTTTPQSTVSVGKDTKNSSNSQGKSEKNRWQYVFHYNEATGRAWITRDNVSGPVPLQDGRFYIEGNSLAELRGVLENPANGLGEVLKEVEAELHNAEVGEQIRNASTPTEAIEQAASSFREEQKSQDQQDIDEALKEFNDFLDNAKGSNVLDKFMRKGLEGNDKAQSSLLDAFTLTNEAQRMFLKDLLRLASKVGYAYIKSGVHDLQAWSGKMADGIGRKLKEVLGWEDDIIGEFVDEVWQQKYTVDGVRMRLSEHAERLKNGNSAKYAKGDVVTFWDSTHTRKLRGTIIDVHETESFGAEYDVSSKLSTDNGPGRGVTTRDHVYTILEGQIVSRDAKVAANSVNVNKEENNEAKKDVSLQQKPASELEGDSAKFAERQHKLAQLSKKIRAKLQGIANWGDQPKPLSAYKQIAKELGIENLSDTDLQELIETEVVNLAREIANKEGLTDEKKFQKIVKLYEGQPSLNARDNDRINKQQYSTPAPMAFLMGLFVNPSEKRGAQGLRGLEPSAGNGMLTIGLPKEGMHVNDIDEMRLSNLQKQGFGQVTSQDGLQPFEHRAYDFVVTNPPFGSVPAKTYDGLYEISGLEHQMAINALESMKDDGRAAIIIGGNTEYNQNGTIKGKDRAFLNYLYSHYNVVDVINMDGKTLYSRQGTGFPVRMILINGRKEFNPRSFAPVIQKARAERVNSYDELYKRVNDDILSDSNESAGVHDTESGESNGKHDNGHAGTSSETGVRTVRGKGGSGQRELLDSGRQPVSGGVGSTQGGTDIGTGTSVGERGDLVHGTGSTATQRSGSAPSRTGSQRDLFDGGNDSERPDGRVDVSVGAGQRGTGTTQQTEQPAVKRGLGTEKVPYRKQSGNPFTLQSLMPAEQADVVKKALEELGDVDQFLVDELGYSSKEELHQALAAEQIDSVAMAIHQMNQGNAFIIGDQTGIGKGRQAAALIRYGVKKGGFPVFITVKKGLFSDMYRDLCDIGSPELRPFIWSADDTEHSADVTDKDGNVVYKRPSDKEQKRVVDYINKYGKLPPEYDYIITTYDSFKGGTMVYEEGQKKARNFGKKQPTTGAYNSQAKRDALEVLSQNSFVIMDESHNAGGEGSAVSGYLQYITAKAKGVTFLSATFAKRPGNMPIYSLKTAISKAGVKVGELIDAVKRGGATFQEIMSKALTEAGQMIRRERDMTGVTIDWKGIEDEDVIEKQRQQYDTIIGLFNDIIDFQRRYVDPIVNKKNDEAADEQGDVDHTPGTRDMGINNTPFASRTYNMVQQVLLSLKAEETAKRAIEHLKAGRKPVIALANTNEGAADEVSTGEDMEMPDLSVNLKKGLQGTLRITKKDAFGNTTNEMISFDELSEAGQARYREIMDAIENASSGLSLSPIDVIKNELKKAGYKVGELTGRKQEFVYNDDGTVKRIKRQDSDKKRTAADFNSGKLDVLILNKSAGTGISLHASRKFDDQRQRVMIVAQAQGDVNDEVQIRGRIDRTGQVLRGMYEYVVSQIPSEQRLLMMLKAKLRSLDANTTSSQKSKFNEMQVQDIINKYGDDIVIQYLAEHPDLAVKMVDPLKWNNKLGEGWDSAPSETLIANAEKDGEAGKTASKVLGRMALLKVAEQEKMLQEIGDLYQAEIDRLNEMGENDLEITEMPLRAKTLKKDVWEEGVEPGGNNPFADNSYVEEVEMDVLRKPMKAEEVKKSQTRLLGGKAPSTAAWEEYKRGVMGRLDAWESEKKKEVTDTITARAEKKAQAEKEKYVKAAKKAQEKNGMTDAEIEKNGQYQYDNFYQEEMNKLQVALDGVDKQKQAFVDALETFTTDGVYALPTDIYDLGALSFEPSFGKVIDIKIADNFSTAASSITFATLDGRRKVTIPISDMVKQSNGEKRDIKPVIVSQTAQVRNGVFGSNASNMLKVLEQNVDNWDRLTSTATRKKGYIITGNLLKALTSLQKQHQGGKLISYTTDTGEIRQGVLMGEHFDPGALTSQNPISSVTQILKDGGQVVSADGDVIITKTDGIDWSHTKPGRHTEWMYQLGVPKSKKRGEKYFNDETLLSLMDDQFEGTSRMRALFPERNLDAVLKRLDELGVTVESKKEDTYNDMDSGYSEDIEEDELFTLEGGYSEETDEEVIERLEKEPKIKVYRAMSLIDGKLYPPMATKQDGQLREPIELGKWEKSDEHPEKAVKRNGKWVFKLTKDNGKSLFAAYNPYIHTSTTMLNDQFSEAQSRPNLVVAEVEVPESELTSGYKAEKAKDAVGRLEWKAGIIQGQLTGTREVILSRWDKPVRIVPTEEVAKSIAKQINGKVEVMPTNVVTPAQREALEKEGVQFIETDNRGKIVNGPNKGKTYSSVYGKKAKNSGYSEGEAKAKPQHTRHKENIRKHVESLLNKLGTRNRTTVITSINGVRNKARREHIESMHKQGKKVYGWFEDGRIYLYLPDIDSIYKAEQTIWHETVAHVGLRELLGTENYGKLLNRLWMQHKDKEMGEWVTRRMQVNGWSLHKAIDEWLAREAEKVVAERQERRTLWQKLAGWIGDILREIGYRTNPTITDVRYLFWLSENQLREGEPMSAIKRAAFLHRLEQENRTAALQRSTKRGSDMDAGYSEDIDEPMGYSEKAVYDERLNRVETVFTEAYQDAMVSLKTAQNAIAHDEDIPDSQNAYMAENLMHGKNKNEMDLFNSMFRDPLIETINKIMNWTGMNWGDIDRYVYTKSGLERNREFFVRDWLERQRKTQPHSYEELTPEEQDIFDRKAETIETLFEDGDIETEEQKEKELEKALQEAHQEYVDSIEERWIGLKQRNYLDLQTGDIDFADYLAGLTNFILDNIDGEYNPSEHDYSGFRAMYGDEEGKYDEDAIIEELMNTEGAIDDIPNGEASGTVALLWGQIRDCTRYGLERYREAGMRSDEQIDRVEQMFHWYVPMRGFKNDTGEDMYQYFTGKDNAKSYVGGLLKHAKGRGSEASYPISTIFTMAYKAISDCNQNLVNQKLYRLCQAHPNDLVVISEGWAELDEKTGEFVESQPKIVKGMTEEEIRQETLRWEADMRQKSTEGKAVKLSGKATFDYKPIDPKKREEHIVDVRINGKKKTMTVVGNPRMAQALNGQLRFENEKNVFWKWNAAIKNKMAALFTSYSPTFALRNMFRDWTHFRMMLGVREGHGYAQQAHKYYRKSLFKMVGLFRKYRKGTLDERNEMERDFKDFMDNGGITGFVQMQKVDDIQKQMERLYKQQRAGKIIRLNNSLWEKILGAVEAVNEAIENNARFATYRASRHYAGRTKARSAYDAKEVTVNFNRKGAGGKTAEFKSRPAGKAAGPAVGATGSTAVENAAKVFGLTSQVLGEGRIFFNATVQAIATTFKNFQNQDGTLNKKYVGRWLRLYAMPPFMFGLALPMINKMLAVAFGGDGDDDPYANLPEWTRRKNLCFYIGSGNFITIPIGQELAAFLSLGDIVAGSTYAPELKPVDKSWDDELIDVMNTFSPVDIATKVTKGGLMEDPVDEVVGRTFSVLAPLVAVGQNLSWTGRPIFREDRFQNDQYTPEYQMVYSGTNPVLTEASKLLHELGGGDDITRGKLEVNPAIVQYLWEQYMGGPGKVFSNTISIGKDLKDVLTGDESEFNIRKVEGLKAFVQQGDDRTDFYRVNAKYRKYKEDAGKLYDAVKGYKQGSAENPEYVLKLNEIGRGKDFVRMQMVQAADKQLSKINKAANKAEGAERKELRRIYNEQVKSVVEMLDRVGE